MRSHTLLRHGMVNRAASVEPRETRILLDFQIDAVHDRCAELPSRDTVFASAGLSWEL